MALIWAAWLQALFLELRRHTPSLLLVPVARDSALAGRGRSYASVSMAVAARLACARAPPSPLVALGASAMLASAVAAAEASRWARRLAFSAFFFPLPLRTLPLTSFFSSSNFCRQHLAVAIGTHDLLHRVQSAIPQRHLSSPGTREHRHALHSRLQTIHGRLAVSKAMRDHACFSPSFFFAAWLLALRSAVTLRLGRLAVALRGWSATCAAKLGVDTEDKPGSMHGTKGWHADSVADVTSLH